VLVNIQPATIAKATRSWPTAPTSSRSIDVVAKIIEREAGRGAATVGGQTALNCHRARGASSPTA
jgi:carbamoylphosphate synthase large subunit